MIFAQMFPGMEWIPLILLAIYAGITLLIIAGIAFATWLLPVNRLSESWRWGVRAFAVVVMVIGISVVLWKSSGPSVHDCQQVQIGMTTHEVKELLGDPPSRNQYPDGGEYWYYDPDWTGLGWFMVRFNADGKVVHKWLE